VQRQTALTDVQLKELGDALALLTSSSAVAQERLSLQALKDERSEFAQARAATSTGTIHAWQRVCLFMLRPLTLHVNHTDCFACPCLSDTVCVCVCVRACVRVCVVLG
jgi:hypothetical protein